MKPRKKTAKTPKDWRDMILLTETQCLSVCGFEGAMRERLTDKYSLSDPVRKQIELTAKTMKTVKRIKGLPPGQPIVIPIESGMEQKYYDDMWTVEKS